MTRIQYTPFKKREIRFEGITTLRNFRIKKYLIRLIDRDLDATIFDRGLELASHSLPTPSTTDTRPGIGFLILHLGNSAEYVILAWWDRENELPTRVFVRVGESWRPASGSESFCVWDLEVMWKERELYVVTMLTEGGEGISAYLNSCV